MTQKQFQNYVNADPYRWRGIAAALAIAVYNMEARRREAKA